MPVVPFTPQTESSRPSPDFENADPKGVIKPDDTWLAIATAGVHEQGRLFQVNDEKPEALESSVRRMGSARFAPETYTDPADQKFLKNLPDDIERIDRGNTIELREKKAKIEDLTS